MSKNKSKLRNLFPVTKDQPIIKLLSYKIVYEPLETSDSYDKLPQAIQDELDIIYSKLSTIMPDSTENTSKLIERIKYLIKLYPKEPKISGYLAVVYSRTGDYKKFEQCVEDNYKKHPDYLFARIYYAEYCLYSKQIEKFEEIFKEGFDLKLLYPHRDCFHISEFVAFSGIICRYYVITGQQQAAELLFQSLEKTAPNHPETQQAKYYINQKSNYTFKA